MKTSDAKYLRRCLTLAEQGRRWTHPNPMVGCVVVREGKIVGEGWHRRFGGSHAEVIALRAAGRKARGATLYVNLEPCPHHGKTPPCADAIIRAGIKKVVASGRDPNPLVSGRGFRRLRGAGIRVEIGMLKGEARQLNEKFHRFMERRIPFVAIKLAQTLDGRIADVSGRSKWITTPQARTYGHQLRSEYDAVLVGAGTVAKDNPRLTVRSVKGPNPVRVLLDGSLSVPLSSRVLKTGSASTIVITDLQIMRKKHRKVVRLERQGVQVLGIKSERKGLDPARVLKVLAAEGIGSVLIEGGSDTIGRFLEKRVVQRIHCFVAPSLLGSGLHGISLNPRPLRRKIDLDRVIVKRISNDIMIEGTIVD